MIRPVGRPAGNHRPPPPSPPRSSSWSTLSPLAPPFTVDRPLAPTTNPSPQPPPPPAHTPTVPGYYLLPRGASNQSHLHLGCPASPPFDATYPWPTSSSSAAAAAQRFHAPPGGYDRSSSSSTTNTNTNTNTTTTNTYSSILASPNTSFPSMPSISVVEAAPYYPRYAPAVGGTPGAIDDGLGPLPDSGGCMGMDLGHWNPFDGEEGGRLMGVDPSSSWMDPSSMFEASTFHKGNASEGFMAGEDSWGPWHGKVADSAAKNSYFRSDCSEWLDGKNPAIFEEYVRAPCRKSGTSVLRTNALQKGMSYYHSPGPVSMMEECNAYNSNSYEKYIAQLVSCSADPKIYHPDMCSSQPYAPLGRRTSPSMDCSMSANTYSSIQHEDPFKVNGNLDYLPAKRNELSINDNTESNEGYMEESVASNYLKANSRPLVDYLSMAKDLPLSNESTTRVSMETELKSGLKIAHLNLPNSFTSGSGPAKPDDSSQTSSETLDQLNLVVDSPCWKGAPASRQFPFDVHDIVDLHSLGNDLTGCGNLVQKHLPVSAVSLLSSLEEEESSIRIENMNGSCVSLLRESSPVVSLTGGEKKFQDADEKGLDCAKVGKEESQCSDILVGQSNPEPKECDVKQLGHNESFVSVDQPIYTGESNLEIGVNMVARDGPSGSGPCASDHARKSISGNAVAGEIIEPLGSSDSAGKCSSHEEDVIVLVMAMHVLSEMLLSTNYGDANESNEHDHELVQLVIDNLKAFILKNKKVTIKYSSLVSGIEETRPKIASLRADIYPNQNNKSTRDMKGKLHCIGSTSCAKFDDFASEGVAKDPGRSCDMAQVLDKALRASSQEQGENPQTLLYKNLWIEAEVALCSLKYELQLARLKLEMENHKNQAKDVTKKPEMENHKKDVTKKPEMENHKNQTKDSSDVAKKPEMENHKNQLKDVSNKVALGARLSSLNSVRALDGRDVPRCEADKSSCCNTSALGNEAGEGSHQKIQDANTKKAEIDASVMARFRVLKGRYEKSNSSVEDHQEHTGGSPRPGDENTQLNVSPLKVDLSLVGRNPQPSTEAELRGGSSIGKLRFDLRHLSSNYEEHVNLSEHVTPRESQVCNADGLVNDLFVPNGKGKHALSCEYDSPSSEWEHVIGSM